MRKNDRFLWAFWLFMLPHLPHLAQLLRFPQKKLCPVAIFASVGFETTDFCPRTTNSSTRAHPNGGFENFSIISLNKSAPEAIGPMEQVTLHPNGLDYFALPNSLLYPSAMSTAPCVLLCTANSLL